MLWRHLPLPSDASELYLGLPLRVKRLRIYFNNMAPSSLGLMPETMSSDIMLMPNRKYREDCWNTAQICCYLISCASDMCLKHSVWEKSRTEVKQDKNEVNLMLHQADQQNFWVRMDEAFKC